MPKVSRTTATERTIVPGMIDSAMAELDGYLIEIQDWDVDMDMAFAAKGLPNDQCLAAHVGYVLRGKVTLHMADGTDEVYEGGGVTSSKPATPQQSLPAPSSSPSHASMKPWPRLRWSGPT